MAPAARTGHGVRSSGLLPFMFPGAAGWRRWGSSAAPHRCRPHGRPPINAGDSQPRAGPTPCGVTMGERSGPQGAHWRDARPGMAGIHGAGGDVRTAADVGRAHDGKERSDAQARDGPEPAALAPLKERSDWPRGAVRESPMP